MALLTEELRALVGRQAVYVSPEEFGLAAGRYFARAVGDDNPLYTSTEAARAVGLPGPVLPPTLLFETNSYTDLPRDDEGFAGHSWGVSPPGTRAVRGGNTYTWERDVLPGDRVTATWTVQDVTERTTRAGRPMVVLTSGCRYEAADGGLIGEQTETLVFLAVET
jgi:acyl dehydratase